MKLLLKAVLILVIPIGAMAQDTTVLKRQAQAMADAMVKGKYAVIVNHTYPKLVAAAGGKEKITAVIKQGMEMAKAQGFTISSATIGSPGKFYKAGTEIHCLLPEMVAMTSANGRLVNNAYLLAISKDGGKFWYFLDINRGTFNMIPKLFPNFNKKLVIPEPNQPSMQ